MKKTNMALFRFIDRIIPGMIANRLSNAKFSCVMRDFVQKNVRYEEAVSTVLMWDMGGFSTILRKNAIFASALNLRGYKTHFLICDGVPEACIQRGLEQKELLEDWSKRCKGCLAAMREEAEKYNLSYSLASEYIDPDTISEFRRRSEMVDLEEISRSTYLGINTGELAWSSVNRYFKGYVVDLDDISSEYEPVYRRYYFGALVNTHIANKIIEGLQPVSIMTSHGVYLDYAPPVSLALLKGLTAISWASGFAEYLHYFTIPKGVNKLQLRGITESEWEKRLQKPLTENEILILTNYIDDRYIKAKAVDIRILAPPDSSEDLRSKLGINNEKPVVCLFTHINWDACFDLSTMIFDNANKWVLESMKCMADVKDVNWIIRVHPGEISDGSLYTSSDIINKAFKKIPENIRVIWHDSDINTYGLYKLIDAGITIFGTVGVELPLFGKPVIAAGEAHFSGKGFSIDAKTKDEYFSIIANAKNIRPLNQSQIQRAQLYAYSYFIQRQIPLHVINKAQGHWGDIDLTKLNELLPGNNAVIDAICNAVINGTDVILDEKTIFTLYGAKEADGR